MKEPSASTEDNSVNEQSLKTPIRENSRYTYPRTGAETTKPTVQASPMQTLGLPTPGIPGDSGSGSMGPEFCCRIRRGCPHSVNFPCMHGEWRGLVYQWGREYSGDGRVFWGGWVWVFFQGFGGGGKGKFFRWGLDLGGKRPKCDNGGGRGGIP